MGIQINGNTDIISATDGSLTIQGADFTAVAAGSTAAPSISPTGDSNTGIFFPSADTVAIAEGGVEALRVNSSGGVQIANGNLVFSTAGTGIDFSATANSSGTMTSELLNDYEEGTWTPTVTTASITVNHARYRKIGSLVYITCSLDVTVGGSNDSAHIYGLPFTVDSSTGNNYVATESRRINENPTILYSIGFGAGSIANKYVGRQFSGNQILAVFADSTSTGQPYGSASWQINITGVRLVVYGWYVATS